MDYFYFVLIILALIAVFIFLVRMDRRTKDRHKTEAYELLEDSSPDPEKVMNCVRMLRLYGGRVKKDPEARELVRRLQDKHNAVFGGSRDTVY